MLRDEPFRVLATSSSRFSSLLDASRMLREQRGELLADSNENRSALNVTVVTSAGNVGVLKVDGRQLG